MRLSNSNIHLSFNQSWTKYYKYQVLGIQSFKKYFKYQVLEIHFSTSSIQVLFKVLQNSKYETMSLMFIRH